MTPPVSPLPFTWGIDATWANAQHIPHGVPAIWPYTTGTADVKWPNGSWADVKAHQVIRVDQGFHSASPFDADEFDIEAGAWTVRAIADVVARREERSMITRLYGGWDKYGLVSEELAAAEMFGNVYWRIADWNLSEQEAALALGFNVYAVQWASPTSNPATIIPGTSTSLKTANADLSVVLQTALHWRG